MRSAPQLTLYTRPQCHLCAVAAPRVQRAALWTGSVLREVNVDDYPELAVDYGLRIPVVEMEGGAVLAEGDIKTVSLWWAITTRRWLSTRR